MSTDGGTPGKTIFCEALEPNHRLSLGTTSKSSSIDNNNSNGAPDKIPIFTPLPCPPEPHSGEEVKARRRFKKSVSCDTRRVTLSSPSLMKSQTSSKTTEDVAIVRTRSADFGRTLDPPRIRVGYYPKACTGSPQANQHRGSSRGPVFVKTWVSKKKNRIITDDGYDLDLAYITKNIIAMGFPSQGFSGVFRNHTQDVKSYLTSRHGNHFKLWNLCIERRYDKSTWDDRVDEFPFLDHNPPPLDYFLPFCHDVDQWLTADERNVAAIHCKAGKGRTGVMIIVYLMFKYKMTYEEGLLHYGTMRTKDLKGVTLPSQKRFIQYFKELCSNVKRRTPAIPAGTVYLKRLTIQSPCTWMGGERARGLQIKIWDNYWRGPKSYKLKEATSAEVVKKSFSTQIKMYEFELPGDGIPLTEEVKIEFFKVGTLAKKQQFRFWFHASFLPKDGVLTLKKNDIDGCHKDHKHKSFAADFTLQLHFGDPAVPDAPDFRVEGQSHEPRLTFKKRVIKLEDLRALGAAPPSSRTINRDMCRSNPKIISPYGGSSKDVCESEKNAATHTHHTHKSLSPMPTEEQILSTAPFVPEEKPNGTQNVKKRSTADLLPSKFAIKEPGQNGTEVTSELRSL